MALGFLARYFGPELARQAADGVARMTGERNVPLKRSPVLDAVNRYLPVSLPLRVQRTMPNSIDSIVERELSRSGGDRGAYGVSATRNPDYFAMDATRSVYGVSGTASTTIPRYASVPAPTEFTPPQVYGTGVIAAYEKPDLNHYR